MPRINAGGAHGTTVQDAVAFIEQVGDPAAVFGHAAGRTREWGREQKWGDTGALRFLPPPRPLPGMSRTRSHGGAGHPRSC